MLVLLLACAETHDGDYELALTNTVSDCVDPPDAQPALALAVRSIEGGGWDVIPADKGCAGRTDGFDCEVANFDTAGDYTDAGADAIISVDLDLAGTWVGASGLTAAVTYTVACTGSDCTGLVSGPERCTSTWTYE